MADQKDAMHLGRDRGGNVLRPHCKEEIGDPVGEGFESSEESSSVSVIDHDILDSSSEANDFEQQPSTNEEKSHELCVVSTFTGLDRFCSVRICHSWCGTLAIQSLMARIEGISSHNLSSVYFG